MLNIQSESNFNQDLNDDIIIAIHKYIAITDAKIAIIQIEDLACESTSVNLPGTDKERPNWQRKIEKNISEIFNENNVLTQKTIKAMKLNGR